MTSPGVAAPGAPPRGTSGTFRLNGIDVTVNASGIIISGPYQGKYPSEVYKPPGTPGVAAPGAPPLGMAGSFTLPNGTRVSVNTAGIITSGPYQGKYPQQVINPPLPTPTSSGGGIYGDGPFKRNVGQRPETPLTTEVPDLNDSAARNSDARARIQSVLREYGLESLGDFVWEQILAGKSDAEVLQDLRNTPEFKKRFPAIEARTKAGLAPLSPGEYVAYERQARQLMRAAGLPEGFYDGNDDFTKFLTGDVSIAELNDRIQLGRQAAYEAPAEVRATLLRDYGISEGNLTAFFLDPDMAQPLIEKQYRAAQIGGASTRTGFGLTSRMENERLADLGVTADQAQQGFSALSEQRELFTALPGQREETVSREEQLGAAFEGNANAARRIQKKARTRAAVFSGGGSYASSNDGVGGLSDSAR